jgi:hypothetical protein
VCYNGPDFIDFGPRKRDGEKQRDFYLYIRRERKAGLTLSRHAVLGIKGIVRPDFRSAREWYHWICLG